MTDPIFDKLGAYLDGELDPRSQAEVQAHLKTCPLCQAEMNDLRRLSHLLQTTPQPTFTPVLAFESQLMLQLPRQAPTRMPQDRGSWLDWIAPILVLVGWFFLQVILGISTLLSFADHAGLLGLAAPWVTGNTHQLQWLIAFLSTIGGLLGLPELTNLAILHDIGLLTQNLFTLLFLQVGVAVVYWGAMTLAWRHKNQIFMQS